MGLAEVDVAVDPLVRALPPQVAGLCVDQAERPLLELEVAALILATAPRQVARSGEVLRHPVGL